MKSLEYYSLVYPDAGRSGSKDRGLLVETSVKMITFTLGLELKFVIKLVIHDYNSSELSQKVQSNLLEIYTLSYMATSSDLLFVVC